MPDHPTEAPSAQRAPSLCFASYDDAGPWPFHLVSARIEWPRGAVSEGWGRDPDALLAQRKAMAEAVERHAYARLPASARWMRARDLPASIGLQHHARSGENGFAADPGWPAILDEERWWLPAFSADGKEDPSNVLADLVCSSDAFDASYRSRLLAQATSSGCASSHAVEDATARATLELVERDAFLRHWFAQVPGDTLRPASLPMWCAARLRELQAEGCDAGVQCLTLGQHPTFLAWAQHRSLHFTCVGAACGFDGEDALRSAMSELETLALARLHVPSRVPMVPADVRTPADHGALYATETFYRRADAVLRGGGAAVRFADVAHACNLDPQRLYVRLRASGHPPFGVDLSVPDASNALDGAPLHTVRAVVPGLLPMVFGERWQPLAMAPRLAPGGRFLHPFN